MNIKNILYFFVFLIIFLIIVFCIKYIKFNTNEDSDCSDVENFKDKNIKLTPDKRLRDISIFCLDTIFNDTNHTLDISRLNNIKIIKSKTKESYTLNKTSVYICINDNISDTELMHVICHELAHCINKTWGHDNNFWDCFDQMISIFNRKNINIDIYVNSNYCKER